MNNFNSYTYIYVYPYLYIYIYISIPHIVCVPMDMKTILVADGLDQHRNHSCGRNGISSVAGDSYKNLHLPGV